MRADPPFKLECRTFSWCTKRCKSIASFNLIEFRLVLCSLCWIFNIPFQIRRHHQWNLFSHDFHPNHDHFFVNSAHCVQCYDGISFLILPFFFMLILTVCIDELVSRLLLGQCTHLSTIFILRVGQCRWNCSKWISIICFTSAEI